MNFIKGYYGLLLAWWDGLIGLYYSVVYPKTSTARHALMLYTGTLWPTGMIFKKEMLNDFTGRRLLFENSCILEKKLANVEYIKSLPDNTLGKTYYNFLKNEVGYKWDDPTYVNMHILKKTFYRTPREKKKRILIKNLYQYHTRQQVRDDGKTSMRFTEQFGLQHDLMHSIMGYKTDAKGELGIHVFHFNHLKIPAVRLVSFFGIIAETIRSLNLKGFFIAKEAYLIGKQVNTNLFMVDWVQHLEDDVDEIKKRYNIKDNVYYKKVCC